MPAEVKKEIELEIAHVLFLDIVGYSKLSVNEQRARVDERFPTIARAVVVTWRERLEPRPCTWQPGDRRLQQQTWRQSVVCAF
jgi:hypothetical protein